MHGGAAAFDAGPRGYVTDSEVVAVVGGVAGKVEADKELANLRTDVYCLALLCEFSCVKLTWERS